MKGRTLGEFIEQTLGSKVKAEYDHLKKKNDLEVMSHGIHVGINIGKSLLGEEVDKEYIEHVYKNFLQQQAG